MSGPTAEPVRGGGLPDVAFALPGIERMRGYGRGLWVATPTHYLTGVRATQVGHGSGVLSMPISIWMSHPDGEFDVGYMADVVTVFTATTILEPGYSTTSSHVSYAPLRRVTVENRVLVARGQVLRSSPDWAFVEATIEDGDGRIVASATAHCTIHPVPAGAPGVADDISPVDPPSYSTPHPFERPVPADKMEIVEAYYERGGLAAAEAIFSRELPSPAIYEHLGLTLTAFDRGSITLTMPASEWFVTNGPEVTGGIVATQAVSASGAAVRTLFGPAMRVDTLRYSTLHTREVPADGRLLTASGTAEEVGDGLCVSRVRTVDDRGDLVSISEGAFRVRETVEPRASPTERRLATILFTDIVGSTDAAQRLGDAKWREVLDRHDALVRRHLGDFGGREVKTTGDGFLATFESPTRAVECAAAIRDDVSALGIAIRAGIHTGECEVAGADVSGIAVHTAARVEAAAGPGEVWVSETTRVLTAGSGLGFSDQGRRELKGIDGDVGLFRLE